MTPLAAYTKATTREQTLREKAERASSDRAAALASMHAGGLSYAKIATLTGLSRSRVQQLVERANQE